MSNFAILVAIMSGGLAVGITLRFVLEVLSSTLHFIDTLIRAV